MDILSFINEITKDSNIFTSHPVKDLSVKERLLYLNGLALVMNADGNISDGKKDYLTLLIKSFDFDECLLSQCVTFAREPEKNVTLTFFQTFRRNHLAQIFLFDAYMLATQDGVAHEKGLAVIETIANQLELLKGTRQDIFHLVCYIRNKDWAGSSLYLCSHLLNACCFKHLLEYYQVDFDLLLVAEKTHLQEKFFDALAIQWTPLSYTNDECLPWKGQITKDFVGNIPVPNELIVPFLQSMLDRGELRVVEGSRVYKNRANEHETDLYFSLDDREIGCDPLSRIFWVSPGKASMPTTLPKKVVMDFLRVVLNITEDSIGYGKKWSEYDNDIGFPARSMDESFLEGEIVKAYDGRFYKNEGVDYANLGNGVLNISFDEIVESGQFRLIR